MAVIEAAMLVTHVLVGAVWTGAVAFVAWQVHPLIARGGLGIDATRRTATGLRSLTRAAAVIQLVTGGHLAAARFEVATLTGTTAGRLVLAMVALWLVLAGLVEMGVARLLRVLDAESVGAAGRETTILFRVAGGVAVLLLLVGGVLAV